MTWDSSLSTLGASQQSPQNSVAPVCLNTLQHDPLPLTISLHCFRFSTCSHSSFGSSKDQSDNCCEGGIVHLGVLFVLRYPHSKEA